MNSETLYWWLSLLGSLASLIGLPIAIWQINKTRRAAEAAKDASLETQKAISRNLLLSDVSICVKYIEEIKNFIRYEKYEAAQIRVSDSVSELIQIQEMLISSNQLHQIEFEKIISQLSNIRNKFEKKLADSSVKISIAVINEQLSLISDNLNKFIGEKKIAVQKGKENG